MPSVRKGESSEKYMSRCVPVVKSEGKTNRQAIGKCYGLLS